jgi:tRNA uridine 5-carboxymethylaminomethyl modification enzyme
MDRQAADIAQTRREEDRVIPDSFAFDQLSGLSNELKQKLSSVRPVNLAQAARIEGMTPAAVSLLLAQLKKLEKQLAVARSA